MCCLYMLCLSLAAKSASAQKEGGLLYYGEYSTVCVRIGETPFGHQMCCKLNYEFDYKVSLCGLEKVCVCENGAKSTSN